MAPGCQFLLGPSPPRAAGEWQHDFLPWIDPRGARAAAAGEAHGPAAAHGALAQSLTRWYQGAVERLEQSAHHASGLLGPAAPGLGLVPSLSCLPQPRARGSGAAAAAGSPWGPAVRRWTPGPRLCSTVPKAYSRRCTGSSIVTEAREDEDDRGREEFRRGQHCQGFGLSQGVGLLRRAASLAAAAAAPGAAEWRAGVCAALATALAPLAVPGAATLPGGVAMAFCPFPPALTTAGGALPGGLKSLSSLGQWDPVEHLSLEDLEKGILVATFIQGSLGLIRICLGDVFSGSYTLLLATLGYNSRRPGPSSNWLKTYVLITFINGTMGGIDIAQSMLIGNFPIIHYALPARLNLMHAVQLLVPGASFLGAYCGWQHFKKQQKVAVQAYHQQLQQQMMMLMEQAPWPPPPLPPLGAPLGARDGSPLPLPTGPPGARGPLPGSRGGPLAPVAEGDEEQA